MMYTVLANLPFFEEYNMSKEKIAYELEQTNSNNVNVSVLTGVKDNREERAIKDADIQIKDKNKEAIEKIKSDKKSCKC